MGCSIRWNFAFCPLGDSYDYRDVVPLHWPLQAAAAMEERSPALQTFNIQCPYHRDDIDEFIYQDPLFLLRADLSNARLRDITVENFKTTTSRSNADSPTDQPTFVWLRKRFSNQST